MAELTPTPFGISRYDNPESIRFRKYATGTHLVLESVPPEQGQTPKEVVWTKDPAKLYRYEPGADKKYSVPILIVYAHILKPYILDLVPGNSLVERLLAEGCDVYLLDWGIPGPEDKNLSFENYVLDYLPEAVERALESSSAEEYTLLGYCMGGTISAMYASLFPEKVKNLVLLAAPIDFAPEKPGLMGLWTLFSRSSEVIFDPDLLVETFGNIPEDLLERLVSAANSATKPLTDQYAAWFCATLRGFLPEVAFDSWLAVGRWVDDGTPFPGDAFRQWVRDFYQENKLIMGEIELRGRRVELSEIECSLLNIAGAKDIICPPSQTEATMELVRSQDKEHLILDAGHVGLIASPEAKKTFWPQMENWLEPRSH
jgi:polyhydroxyalkanoate synthase subunit PhaC